MRAFFGPPRGEPTRGGAQVTISLVPVFEGRLVAFDVSAREARGRWLPWHVMEYGANPYESASELADDWLGGELADLSLADVLSLTLPDVWELALVFRAQLVRLPPGDAERRPFVFAPGEFDAIGPFDPVDLRRWVETLRPASAGERQPGQRGSLLF